MMAWVGVGPSAVMETPSDHCGTIGGLAMNNADESWLRPWMVSRPTRIFFLFSGLQACNYSSKLLDFMNCLLPCRHWLGCGQVTKGLEEDSSATALYRGQLLVGQASWVLSQCNVEQEKSESSRDKADSRIEHQLREFRKGQHNRTGKSQDKAEK